MGRRGPATSPLPEHVAERGASPEPRLAPIEPSADLLAAGAARSTLSERASTLLFMRTTRRFAPRCELADHLAEMRREAERLAQAQADVIVAVIDAVLDGLALPASVRARGIELAVAELRKHAEAGAA